MRASPPLQITLAAFGFWRAGVMALALAAASTPLAWLWAQPQRPSTALVVLAGLLALVAMAFGAQLQRMPARSLRWDGQCWHVGPAASAGDEPAHGELSVAIDFGSWMLLRFVDSGRSGPSNVVWLPAQRRGLESRWHALRCAVYSPRPAPDEDASVRA